MTERNRALIYRLLVLAGGFAVFYGWLTEEQLALWLAAVANTLGVGLAAFNTSTDKE